MQVLTNGEYCGPIIELVKLISSPISECCKFHRGVDEEMGSLRDKWQYLEARKTEIESRIGRKQPTKQVELWLGKVDTIKGEVQAIEGKFAKMKYFSRAHVGKLASKMITKVENHYKMELPGSLVLDPPGETLSTTVLIGESTVEKVKKEIWACLLDDNDVRKIGVYGMGGIGKSTVMEHINNSLLKETNKFDSVIWVTVSKSFNVIQLQHDIARKLDLDLTKVEDVRERATKLREKLEDKKRFVLILDDMWEAFALEKVGIPEPTLSNGCKLVLTTRLLDVCLGMSCKNIKMELLSKEEAQNLFLDKLGRDVFNTPDLKVIAEEVLERCAQLPLAIVTIAASFKCLIHDFEWRDALEDLKTSVKGSNNIEAEIFKILEFSYERLKDEKLQQCLLHCALYPEDFKIEKPELIEHLIDEGIIERRNSRQAEFDRGYSMLNKLENACLLEGGIEENDEEKFVKMHDLVRDMVLRVASPQFKVEGHLGLEDFSDEGKWGEDLVKASLMYNDISRIPPNASPMCPKLSTLLLQGNESLKDVPDSLFEHLHGLNILDLSDTGIESLPNSVSNLENLTTLRLRRCRKLKHVPSLAKLTKLRKLDLESTKIMEVPHGLEMLVNLRYLNLNVDTLKIMPPEILPKLSCLQYLKFFPDMKLEEVASLKNLETFGGRFSDMYEFSTYMEKGQLATYEIHVGSISYLLGSIRGKRVVLHNCNISRGEESFVLPKDVHDLEIVICNNLRCLCDIPSLNHATELKTIYLNGCKGIEHILCSSSSCCTLPLQLFRKEKDASAQVPPHTFSRLKKFSIFQCPKLKKLLPPGLLLHLHNLELIIVFDCEQLEEIIEEEEEEKEEEGMDTTKITLPRLKTLSLQFPTGTEEHL
uniref:AAA+ ATPase domain-containing protein n=1 Tax=Fagus sylvatica TaxID=28930 RepID=A0A2N9G4F6_FAGSY